MTMTMTPTYRNQKLIPHEPVPGVIWIICQIGIEEERPLIPTDLHLTTPELLFDPATHLDSYERQHVQLREIHYPVTDQSKPAGHSNAPVLS
jgi:hypothetical protein